MKTILFILLLQLFFLVSIAGDKSKKTTCPNFQPRVTHVNYHPHRVAKHSLSHRAQIRRNTPTSCRKKRRTGEVQHFLKIQ
jgi:hypothetical protein